MSIIPRKTVAREHGPDDVLAFGKYKGLTVLDVAKINASYLVWAVKNIGTFELTPEARTLGQKHLDNVAVRREAWAWGLLPSQRFQDWGGLTDEDMRHDS